jgi:two-component system, NtrC family, response regulator GlrR
MRIDLMACDADPLAAAAASELRERLQRLLPSGDQCVLHATPRVESPSMVAMIVLLNASQVGQACDVCTRARTETPACTVLAAGGPAAHEVLESLFSFGVADLLYLPISDFELAARLGRAIARGTAHDRASDGTLDPRLQHVIALSPSFRQLLVRLPTLAASNSTVLILGETGTGKEVLAQAVHYLSPRAAKPWVPIDCGAIPIELLESELFGHVKGAYTTAGTTRAGLIEQAEGGTLFLDEVDCLPVAAQAKLLRLLQEREYRPVGSNVMRRADIRIVAASNRDLRCEATRGSFRKDLYYRLNVVSMTLPPLRDRREDVQALARHFVERNARRLGKPIPALAPHALRKLIQHQWPGNIRELQHAIERAVLLSTSNVLGPDDIQLDGHPDLEPGASFRDAKATIVRRFERDYIEDLLTRCGGNITHAAREAGKNRRAFFELIRKHDIEVEPFRGGISR